MPSRATHPSDMDSRGGSHGKYGQQFLPSETRATAPYETRPPSPPVIHVPTLIVDPESTISITPSCENADPSQLTLEELTIITRNKAQVSQVPRGTWGYESRRVAQPILDFIYLGPSSVTKDREFLQREGITMLLGVRDSKMAQAQLMMRVRDVAQELGIAVDFVDIESHHQVIAGFNRAVDKINRHLLAVYRSQAVEPCGMSAELPQGQISTPIESFRRGKVLVFCETGNIRSAAIVAAYLMAVFGMSVVTSIQFICLKRFCVDFNEESKRCLKSFEDILNARKDVSRARGEPQTQVLSQWAGTRKRSLDSMDTDGDCKDPGNRDSLYDDERFTDRPAFAPFIDSSVTGQHNPMQLH